MTQNEANREAAKAQMLIAIRKATGKRPVAGMQPWPGLPVGQLSPLDHEIAADLVADGLIERVGRPSHTNNSRTAWFYRRVS